MGLVLPKSSFNPFRGVSSIVQKPVVAFPNKTVVGGYAPSNYTGAGGTSRHQKFAFQKCSSIEMTFGNFDTSSDSNVPTGACPLTVQAVIEYPKDTFTAVTFGGNSSTVIPFGGLVKSDPCHVVIPQYATFWVRTFVVASYPGYIPYTALATYLSGMFTGSWASDTSNCGDNYAPTNSPSNTKPTNDLLTTGQAWMTQYAVNTGYSYGPLSIHGVPIINGVEAPNQPVVGILGDSIGAGHADTLTPNNGYIADFLGYPERACIAGLTPYINVAKASEAGVTGTGPASVFFLSDKTCIQRMRQLEMTTHLLWEFGTNDFFYGAVWSTFRPAVLAAWAKITAIVPRLYALTVIPRLQAAYTAIGNQTTVSTAFDSVRQSYNAWLRAPYSSGAGNSAAYDCANYAGGAIPLIAVFDAAALIETDTSNTTPGGPSNPNLGNHVWMGSNGSTIYLRDGIHPNSAGCILLQAAINTALFTAPV